MQCVPLPEGFIPHTSASRRIPNASAHSRFLVKNGLQTVFWATQSILPCRAIQNQRSEARAVTACGSVPSSPSPRILVTLQKAGYAQNVLDRVPQKTPVGQKGVAKMDRRIDLSKHPQQVFLETQMTDNLPDDYVLEAHELVIDALQAGKSDGEIVDWLCEYFRRPHKDLNPELARLFLHKTKSRWQRYLIRYAEVAGKPGRPKALGMKAVLALVSLMKASPRECGYAAECWTVACLLDALRRWGGVYVSDHTLRRVLHDIGFEWNGWGYSRDLGHITTGSLVNLMRLPHRLNLSDCLDEEIIRSVINRVNQMSAGDIPPEPPDSSESVIE